MSDPPQITVSRFSDLETRMHEFEEKFGRDPQSFSPLPRERAVLQGGELAKSAEIGRTLAHFRPLTEAAIEQGQSHGALAFMATEHGLRRLRGVFLVRDPTAEPRTAGSEARAERWRDLDAMFLNLKMKRAWQGGGRSLDTFRRDAG